MGCSVSSNSYLNRIFAVKAKVRIILFLYSLCTAFIRAMPSWSQAAARQNQCKHSFCSRLLATVGIIQTAFAFCAHFALTFDIWLYSLRSWSQAAVSFAQVAYARHNQCKHCFCSRLLATVGIIQTAFAFCAHFALPLFGLCPHEVRLRLGIIQTAFAFCAHLALTLFASLMKLLPLGITNKFVLRSLTRNFWLLTFDIFYYLCSPF